MTGTSLDGIDVAICDFILYDNSKIDYSLVAFDSFELSKSVKFAIQKVIEGEANLKEISALNHILPKLYLEAINNLCLNYSLDYNSIDSIAMHGQTIYHQPKSEPIFGFEIASTWQLGSGTALAALANKKVIYDFRAQDIALGGEAAPLVPIFDYYFLKSKEDTIALNIGGISNLTYINDQDHLIAFDTGPGNLLIDYISKTHFDADYDKSGKFAFEGIINEDLVKSFMKEPFIISRPPKSSGRELFNHKFLEYHLNINNLKNIDKFDLIASAAEFTSISIAYNIKKYAKENSILVVSGGGSKNDFIMSRLKYHLPDANIIDSSEIGINSDAKEAIAFAFLGFLTLNNIPANLPEVTGASRKSILGSIANS